jgi:outer membrane lipoprotein
MKWERLLTTTGAVLLVIALVACSPPFPEELLQKVEKDVPFTALLKDPGNYAGKLLMLGGTIVETKNLTEGTRIEVLQRPLDGEARPELSDRSDGRFLILAAQFLDGALYQRGRTISVIGEVVAPQVLPLGEIEYRYPVVAAKSLHLWAPSAGPSFSIGIGVYRGF